jgi:hypothetical protein
MAAEDYIDFGQLDDPDFMIRGLEEEGERVPRNVGKRKIGKKKPVARFERSPGINRFYVGAANIADAIERGANDPWTCETLQEAIDSAKHKMEEENSDIAIVVQIIRILRRDAPPITVEIV